VTLTDTHCHLDSNKFDADRAGVIARAAQAGITRILIPGVTRSSSRSAIQLAESHKMLFAGVGIHPTETADFDGSTLDDLRKMAQHPKVKAIGEIGLDYYWDLAPHELQQKVLREQLDLAGDLHLPVVVHFREKGDTPDGECAQDLLKILEEWTERLRGENNRGAAFLFGISRDCRAGDAPPFLSRSHRSGHPQKRPTGTHRGAAG
jgi:TatD family hydrolase